MRLLLVGLCLLGLFQTGCQRFGKHNCDICQIEENLAAAEEKNLQLTYENKFKERKINYLEDILAGRTEKQTEEYYEFLTTEPTEVSEAAYILPEESRYVVPTQMGTPRVGGDTTDQPTLAPNRWERSPEPAAPEVSFPAEPRTPTPAKSGYQGAPQTLGDSTQGEPLPLPAGATRIPRKAGPELPTIEPPAGHSPDNGDPNIVPPGGGRLDPPRETYPGARAPQWKPHKTR